MVVVNCFGLKMHVVAITIKAIKYD